MFYFTEPVEVTPITSHSQGNICSGGQSSIPVRPCPMSTLELLEASNMGQESRIF